MQLAVNSSHFLVVTKRFVTQRMSSIIQPSGPPAEEGDKMIVRPLGAGQVRFVKDIRNLKDVN
jgi:hypothetical protein